MACAGTAALRVTPAGGVSNDPNHQSLHGETAARRCVFVFVCVLGGGGKGAGGVTVAAAAAALQSVGRRRCVQGEARRWRHARAAAQRCCLLLLWPFGPHAPCHLEEQLSIHATQPLCSEPRVLLPEQGRCL